MAIYSIEWGWQAFLDLDRGCFSAGKPWCDRSVVGTERTKRRKASRAQTGNGMKQWRSFGSGRLYQYWPVEPEAILGVCETSVAVARICQMRSIQSRCSGFISTERKQVMVSRSRCTVAGKGKKLTGKSARARCRPRSAAAAKIARDFAETSLTLTPSGAKTTISSSGANEVRKRSSAVVFSYKARAADLPRSRRCANSPCFMSGRSFCVAHNAEAEAPGREHSRLISPKCNSAELK